MNHYLSRVISDLKQCQLKMAEDRILKFVFTLLIFINVSLVVYLLWSIRESKNCSLKSPLVNQSSDYRRKRENNTNSRKGNKKDVAETKEVKSEKKKNKKRFTSEYYINL